MFLKTIFDAITDNKQYYNCPSCHREVWAYGGFKGNICLNCPGTFAHATYNTMKQVHPGGIIVDAIESSQESEKASAKGSSKYRNKYGSSNINNLTNNEKKLKIKKYITRGCRIGHGSVNWVVSTGSNIANIGPFEHWWLNIMTEDYNWYQLQFKNSSLIELRKCNSSLDCDYNGLWEAHKHKNSEVFSKTGSCHWGYPKYTLQDVATWLGNYNSNYSITKNNCQKLCKDFSIKFQL